MFCKGDIFSWNPAPVNKKTDTDNKKNKKDVELVPNVLFPNIFRNILYQEIYHKANFDDLIQSGRWVTQKILC